MPSTEAKAASKRPTVASGVARAATAAALTLFAAVFILSSAPYFTGPFGQSDEGLNGAGGGLGSRAYRVLGPIDSVFGGRWLDGRSYATHPPLLWTQTAILESFLGEHRWATRSAAWLGSLAVIALVYFLARALSVERVPAVAATVAALGTAMFFTYGWMLDTPVTSLPFGLLAALVWQRDRAPRGPALASRGHRVAAFAAAFVAALSGWQAMLFVFLLGAWSVLERLKSQHRGVVTDHPVPSGIPYCVGSIGGFLVSAGWGLWVYGDLAHLTNKFLLRSGGEHSSLSELFAEQGRWSVLLLGIGLIGLGGAILSLRDPRFRPLAAVALITVFGYMMIFRGGASGHPFWNYWALVPTAVGYTYLFDRLQGSLIASGTSRRLISGVIVTFAIVAATSGIVLPNAAKSNIEVGMQAVMVIARANRPPSQTTLPYVGDLVMPETWMLYEFNLTGQKADDRASLQNWGAQNRDQVVLVAGPCPPGDKLCDALWDPSGPDYQVIRGADLVVRLSGPS